jgi:hypothetical protein
MDEVQYAQLAIGVGFTLVILFIILNFGIERIWFTPPHRMTPNNMKPVPPLVGGRRRGHIVMGSIESAFFIVGWFLVVAGFAVLGTRGYGSF